MRRLLDERNFPVDEIRFFASGPVGGYHPARGRAPMSSSRTPSWPIRPVSTSPSSSAGATSSKSLAPKFAAAGVTVIDNSSAWRMDPDVPLIRQRGQRPAHPAGAEGHHRQPELHDDGGDAGAQAASRRSRAHPPRRVDVPGGVRRRAGRRRRARQAGAPGGRPCGRADARRRGPSSSRRPRSSPSRSRSTCCRSPDR